MKKSLRYFQSVVSLNRGQERDEDLHRLHEREALCNFRQKEHARLGLSSKTI